MRNAEINGVEFYTEEGLRKIWPWDIEPSLLQKNDYGENTI
jgi:hypothetical protein